MTPRIKLTILSFLEFFIWGSWLITVGAYWFQNRQWSGAEFGAIFSTMGLSAIFMPALAGIIADRYLNAERLLGLCHLIGAVVLFYLPQVNDPGQFYWVLLFYMLFYMPTISLANTVSYTVLVGAGKDIVKEFPPIRVWGTVGFIVAMWVVSLLRWETSALQFYVAGSASVLLGVYAFSYRPVLLNPPIKGLLLLQPYWGYRPFHYLRTIKWPSFSYLLCYWVPLCS